MLTCAVAVAFFLEQAQLIRYRPRAAPAAALLHPLTEVDVRVAALPLIVTLPDGRARGSRRSGVDVEASGAYLLALVETVVTADVVVLFAYLPIAVAFAHLLGALSYW